MRIQQTKIDALESIVALKIAMFADAGLKHLLADDVEQLVLSDYQRMYNDKRATHFAVYIDNQIVSVTGAFIKSDIPYRYYKAPEYGFIGDVYTLPEFRNKGFASKLNALALEWLRNKGVPSVRLLAAPEAASIYKRLGYKYTDEMVLHLR